MQLVQGRECDGACCKESPRFPNADHSDCIYHDTKNGKENAGCALMRGDAELPSDGCVNFKDLSIEGVFNQTCVLWPQQNSIAERSDTGGCCWQWVDDGN